MDRTGKCVNSQVVKEPCILSPCGDWIVICMFMYRVSIGHPARKETMRVKRDLHGGGGKRK